jgi:Ion channel
MLMGWWGWPITALGVVMAIAILLDVVLSVFHLDLSGPISTATQRVIARFMVLLSKRFRWARRNLLALIGPAAIVSTLFVWVGLFILSFALLVWPHMNGEAFSSSSGPEPLGFTDALYYSGGTGTVLGFGDITPQTPVWKILAFVEAGLGFALMTAIITYMLTVTSAVAERNALSNEVLGETDQAGHAVNHLILSFNYEDISGLHNRLQGLLDGLQGLRARLRELPVIELYYRSRDPSRDFEPMMRAITEMTIAGQLLCSDERAKRLYLTVEGLVRATTDVMNLVVARQMSDEVLYKFQHPEPEQRDVQFLEDVRGRLVEGIGAEYLTHSAAADEAALVLAFRLRLFLKEIDRLTGWSIDHIADADRELYRWDTDFDHIGGITRVEPE